MKISLTQGKYALIDKEDFDLVNKYNWIAVKKGNKYYVRSIQRPQIYLHRLILGLKFGDGKIVDHINRNPLDNKRCNLRICSYSQNSINSPTKIGTSKYRGVYWNKQAKKWEARIRTNNKKLNLGQYTLEELAALAYDIAATKHHKEFAITNF